MNNKSDNHMLAYLSIYLFVLISRISANTFVFSGGTNTYVSFESWRPCLTGYIRFDIRTTIEDGTLAYIDDRGKFDFFYLKLIQGKPRLLFNLGNDRQALNVNTIVNDDKWHTILIQRNGQMTSLDIDNGLTKNSTPTHSDDLYFGGSNSNEYQASVFYFGGIPAILERPSSGNLSSFDVYMQPRFRGQLRNLIYKNCTESPLVQPKTMEISGGISLIPNSRCSGRICGQGICLTTDQNYKCLCDETDYQGKNCQYERQTTELTFHGKQYLTHQFNRTISSANEILTFQLKSNHYDGLIFQLIDSKLYIKLKDGQLILEYRVNNSWYEFTASRDIDLIDNRWHYVQIKRHHGQITMIIDQWYFPIEHDIKVDQLWNFTRIFLGGNEDFNIDKFHGCLKDISLIFNENLTVHINQSFTHGYRSCKSLVDPIQFLTSSSFLSFDHGNLSHLSFRFETFSLDGILLYSQSHQDFLGLDLLDGFFYLTINANRKKQRQELFQQRFNDGRPHFFQMEMNILHNDWQFNMAMDYRQTSRLVIRNSASKINFHSLTIGGVNPADRWLPSNYYSGITKRGFIGCFSNLEMNNELINLTRYINSTENHIAPISGPCSARFSIKRECLCEHNGECRSNNGGRWSCDCSKTGYTGRRCEQMAYHLDLGEMQTLELNTNIQWSDQMNIITFGLQTTHDEESFLQVRSCRLLYHCDSIDFSIRNGLLHVNFSSNSLPVEYPFLFDNQWHSIVFQRLNTSLLLHIDHHIIQQRVNINPINYSLFATVWLVFYGHKQVRIEDLRVYDQTIFPKLLNSPIEYVKIKTRSWKPLNAISFAHQQNSYLEIQLNEILCQDCQLNTLYFQFRTTDLNGLLLFARIRTNTSTFSEYLILKLVNGQLHFLIINRSLHELYRIQTKQTFNNNDWHHFSFDHASAHHLELTIDSQEYFLPTSIHFLDRIYFGHSPASQFLNPISTIQACLASLTLDSQPINFREYIKPIHHIRNDCHLDSQCPLKQCANTGICRERIQCDCQHTSFQGKYCTNLKLGYAFNDSTPGVIFDQPFHKEKTFSNYKISFGIVTKINLAEIIRINDLIAMELFQGSIRMKLIGNEYVHHDQMINDGYYHLVQMEYNISGYVYLNVDNRAMVKQVKSRIVVDKPLLLLIGQNPAFKYPFQGQLYGLQSDIYSIFDLISPAFHRISFAPIRKVSFSTSPSIIYSQNSLQGDAIHSSCSYQPYDDICIISSDRNSSRLAFPNLTLSTTSFSRPTKKLSTSTLPYRELNLPTFNSTEHHDIPPLIVSIRTPDDNPSSGKFHWRNTFILVIPITFGVIVCLILSICCCLKYRRKDVGVYELEETRRFRPLIVELPRKSGENAKKLLRSTPRKSSNRRKRQKSSPLIDTDEQREFYI